MVVILPSQPSLPISAKTTIVIRNRAKKIAQRLILRGERFPAWPGQAAGACFRSPRAFQASIAIGITEIRMMAMISSEK